jgi:PAS domain S-box-containing protein
MGNRENTEIKEQLEGRGEVPLNLADMLMGILNNSELVIVTTNLQGRIVFATPNVESLLKVKSAALTGKDIRDFFEEEDFFDATVRERLMAEKEIRNIETVMKRAGGDTFPAHLSVSLLAGEDGKQRGILGIYRDITEKKKLAEQLLQSRKMEAIGTLAGGIAHDFNNLLMGIHGYVSLMLFNMPASHPHFDMLKSIELQVQSGADLTKKLLGFAKGGKYEVLPTDMNDLVKKSIKIFGRTKKEIRIHCRYAKQVWAVEVDPGQIDHLLLNLYINAWQAMPEGGNLYVETENVQLDDFFVNSFKVKPGPYVKVSVSDTGVGMDEQTKQRVFEPFFTTKERGRGTGLGLASVYGIVKNHGGLINLYSEKGKGTTVVFYLPATRKAVVKQIKPENQLQSGSETILIIDDEKEILHVTGEMLKMLGYSILAANNGQEGVKIYQSNWERVDLVLLDMIMPGMTGYETFAAMKKVNPAVKVLLASGYSMNGRAREIIDQGCRGFIQKPFGMEELSEKIAKLISDNRIKSSVA